MQLWSERGPVLLVGVLLGVGIARLTSGCSASPTQANAEAPPPAPSRQQVEPIKCHEGQGIIWLDGHQHCALQPYVNLFAACRIPQSLQDDVKRTIVEAGGGGSGLAKGVVDVQAQYLKVEEAIRSYREKSDAHEKADRALMDGCEKEFHREMDKLLAPPAPPLPARGESCTETRACRDSLSCVEQFEALRLAGGDNEKSFTLHDTGQRGKFNGADETIDVGGDCENGFVRVGQPGPSGSSNTTCTAAWLTDNPSDCRARVHQAHGWGHWHCRVDAHVQRVQTSSKGFVCQ
jgi:hypothetical protein